MRVGATIFVQNYTDWDRYEAEERGEKVPARPVISDRSIFLLVTGGSSGIGRATALIFAREGAKVVVADVNVEGGAETVRLLNAAGGEAVFVQTDVARAVEVETLVTKAVDTYGRLDCAFNNAGIEGVIQPTAEYGEEHWDRVLAINLKGVWLCMKYEIPPMLKQGSGAIVNTASVAGLVGLPG